jgi:hypothetical protein
VFKPVSVVKDEPKERAAGVTYFVEGSRDTAKAKLAAAKRKAFAQGSSGTFSIIEDELNVLAGPAPGAPTPAGKPKAGEKPADKAAPPAKAAPGAPPPPANGEIMSAGTPNFRIRNGTVQIGFPVALSVMGVDANVIVQAQGSFVKDGATFAFEPETLMVGGCPVQRLPYASGYVRKRFLASQTIAEDISAAWPKVTAISVEGSVLKLTMP